MGSGTTTLEQRAEQAHRLESIFMPHARKQRDEIYKDAERPKRFVHYTSADAALKIVLTKRIWLRNTTCMSDYREVQHGFEILSTVFSDKNKCQGFTAALEECAAGSAQEAINLFNQWMPDIRLNSFIASLSEHDDSEDLHGRLSMWRAFGGNTARVAIVLDIPRMSGGGQALNLIFSPVAYLSQGGVEGVLDSVIENICKEKHFLQSIDRPELINFIFHMLVAGVVCLKHEGFQEEREWRAVYSPNRGSSPLMESGIEVVGGIPQNIFKIPFDKTKAPILAELDFAAMFNRLIIGPTQYPWPMAAAFIDVLVAAGVPDAAQKVFASGIPIRT